MTKLDNILEAIDVLESIISKTPEHTEVYGSVTVCLLDETNAYISRLYALWEQLAK